MPSLQDIEQFKTRLNALGSEADLLAERGESIEELPPPEFGPPDLSDLFTPAAPAAPGAKKAPAAPAKASGEEFDFSSLFGEESIEGLDNLEEATAGKREPAVEAETAEPEAFELPEPIEAPAAPEAPLEAGLPAGDEAAERALEEFGIPPGLLESFGAPAEAPQEAAPEMPLEMPAPEGETVEVPVGGLETPAAEAGEAGETVDFTLPPDFGIHDEGAEPGEAPPLHEEVAAPPAEAAPPVEEEILEFPAEFGGPEFAGPEFAGPEAAAEEAAPEVFEAPALEFPEMAEAPAAPAAPAAEAAEAGAAEAGAAPSEEEFSLSERRFAALKRTLATLPRNLKMLVEDLVAVKGLTGPDLRLLTDLLADGAAPTRIAEEVSRITGRRIRLPRGYERVTGLAFEEERRSFRYALRENIWPILRVGILSLLFLGLLSFLGYRYIVRPLYANSLYRQGHAQILKGRFKLGEERFAKANAMMHFKGWYLRYADAYIDQKQYPLAADKYELLLQHFPLDRQGVLRYASLLTYSLFGYERADRILGQYMGEYEPDKVEWGRFVPKNGFKDKGILLARGDNYLEWAAEEPSHYEDARLQYASILDYHGEQDEVLFRMMRYFMRVKPPLEKEIHDLYLLLEGKDRLAVPAELHAAVYTELAGFWLDRDEHLDEAFDALQKAMKRNIRHPELHYQLARYHGRLKDSEEEYKALGTAIELLKDAPARTRPRLLALIDSYNRRGQWYWRAKQYLDAEKDYQSAIALIESAQQQKILGPSSQLGLPYQNRGDLYYYVSRDLDTAYEMYAQAERNQLQSPELDYRIGYIEYAREDFAEALLKLSRVVDQKPTSENALYALANTLFYQGFYSSAQGYFLRVLDLLELRRDQISYLEPAENSEHRNLLEFMMKVYNNLGVTYMRLYEARRDPERQARALANLTFSSEYYDVLTRDPDTAERTPTKNLAYLNQRAILYPAQPFELQLYGKIPLDLEAARF